MRIFPYTTTYRISFGGSEDALVVDNDHIFDTTTERDEYFDSYPDELVDGVYVSVDGTLYKYTDSAWVDVTPVIQGADGADGSDGTSVAFQYSADGESDWHDDLDTSTDNYWRWSLDGGTTWTTGVKFTGSNLALQYSADDETWTDSLESDSIYWRWSVDNGTTWTDGVKFSATDMEVQYSVDGESDWHSTLDISEDLYWRWSVDGGTTWGDAAKFAASDLVVQYSEDGESDWHETLDVETDTYWRWSVDDGTTWSTATRFSATDIQFQFSPTGDSDNDDWHSDLDPDTDKYWRWSVDGGLTWSADGVKYEGTLDVDPYTFTVSDEGELVITKDGVEVSVQDEEGIWIKNSVTTGTGSYHLGEVHSISSSGENVVFRNEVSNIAYFPLWQGYDLDAETFTDPVTFTHAEDLTTLTGGTASTDTAATSVDFTPDGYNIVLHTTTITPAEDYTGDLHAYALAVDSDTTSYEIASAIITDATLTTGTEYTFTFPYPLWCNDGETTTLIIEKYDDGTTSDLLTYLDTEGSSIVYTATGHTYTKNVVYNGSNLSFGESLSFADGVLEANASSSVSFEDYDSTKGYSVGEVFYESDLLYRVTAEIAEDTDFADVDTGSYQLAIPIVSADVSGLVPDYATNVVVTEELESTASIDETFSMGTQYSIYASDAYTGKPDTYDDTSTNFTLQTWADPSSTNGVQILFSSTYSADDEDGVNGFAYLRNFSNIDDTYSTTGWKRIMMVAEADAPSETDLSYLQDTDSNIQDQLDAITGSLNYSMVTYNTTIDTDGNIYKPDYIDTTKTVEIFVNGVLMDTDIYTIGDSAITYDSDALGYELDAYDNIRIIYYTTYSGIDPTNTVSMYRTNPTDETSIPLPTDSEIDTDRPIQYYINGLLEYSSLFTVDTTDITWDSSSGGYELLTTDVVIVIYYEVEESA